MKSESPEVKWPDFLSARVRQVISSSVKVEELLRGPYGKLALEIAPETQNLDGVKAESLSHLWLYRTLNFPGISPITLNLEKPVDLESANVGVLKLYPSFLKGAYDMQRMGVLLHEARHSDCENGLEEETLSRLQMARTAAEVNEIMGASRCLYGHSFCGAGDYEGKQVCDAHAWGANAIEMKFYREIALSCTNCTDVERSFAKIKAIDLSNRLSDFEGFIGKSEAWKEIR